MSPLSNITDSVKDEEHYEEDDTTFEDQLKEEIEKKLSLWLNEQDRDSGI